MPEGFTVQVTGLREMEAMFDRLREWKRPTILRAMKRAAKPMVALAKAKCPVGEGRLKRRGRAKTQSSGEGGPTIKANKVEHLRDTIRAKPGDGGDPHAVHVYVGTKYPTAHLVEYGHANVSGRVVRAKAAKRRQRRIVSDTRRSLGTRTPAHPFMRPAHDATIVQVVAGMQGAMKIELDKALAKQGLQE